MGLKLGDLDVVYVLKRSEVNEELRYSLRSLRNFPHRKVWFIGYKPQWTRGVLGIDLPQEKAKWDNGSAAYEAITQIKGISEDFVIFNDDFFVMNPVTELDYMYDRTLSDRVEDFVKIRGDQPWSTYMNRLTAASNALKERGFNTFNYELHKPMVFNKTKLYNVLRKMPHTGGIRSVYANYYNLGGKQTPDGKIYYITQTPSSDITYLSTTDQSFKLGSVGLEIRRRLPGLSPYEK